MCDKHHIEYFFTHFCQKFDQKSVTFWLFTRNITWIGSTLDIALKASCVWVTNMALPELYQIY